jgi:hypothetical protein
MLTLALALTVALIVHPLGANEGGVMFMLPALVLGAFLLGGRFPGERIIERLARTHRAATAGPRREAVPRQRPRDHVHGGRLIAASLAGRGPPLPAVLG